MRWIALHLPLLSLESLEAALPGGDGAAARPLALMDARRALVAVNRAARERGIEPGQKRATALAIAPQLVLGEADPARDAQALAAVVHAALAFTPMVTVQPPNARDAGQRPADTVLLEVHSTLRCFGGARALHARLQDTLAPLGHRIHVVDAPLPLGAALLARQHERLYCADRKALAHALDAAPVWLLGPGREHWEALQGMGLRTLAELRRLPRAGLARRFGEALLDELDRAYGDRPDPREPVVPAERFASRLELLARADRSDEVLHGAAVLLARLVAWLAARHAFVRRFVLAMHHEPRWRHDAATPPATLLEVALAEPSRDAVHLQRLLRERLAAIALPAPTIELTLEAHEVVQQPAPSGELFPTPAGEREGLVRLVERLQARLGPEQVQRVEIVDDHRPERATAVRPGGVAAAAPARPGQAVRVTAATALPAARPVWLLAPPEPLGARDDERPLLDGAPLQLLSGPERIESGWWDGELAERDYFIAETASGALVWVYRARLPRDGSGWFLQGRFG